MSRVVPVRRALTCTALVLGTLLHVLHGAVVIEKYPHIVDNRLDATGNLLPSCPSEIYCQGQLLHTVQMKEIYTDSKTFVDMKMKGKPKETLEAFNAFMAEKNNDPSREELKAWVESNFEKPGAEFEDWIPDDWVANPAFLKHIKDADLREFASKLNQIWHELGRKMIADVAINSDQYSIIPVDHPVIVPGGRFREFYYWDSYWIVKGLLLSEMKKTTRGMLENFLSIVQRYGFIPNGGRIYYSMRSQPPLLCAMVKAYVDATNDTRTRPGDDRLLRQGSCS